MKVEIHFTKYAEKQVSKLPIHIKKSLQYWIATIFKIGLKETRKIPGYHDEELSGKRINQRSIRLNRGYRVIYFENDEGEILIITILEVNKHEY